MSILESDWLQELTISSIATVSSPPLSRHGKIVFSRSFVPTYKYVVLGSIALFAVTHWAEKAIRWKRRRISSNTKTGYQGDTDETLRPLLDQDIKNVYSSSSSTLEGNASPPIKLDEEHEESPRSDFPISWKSIIPSTRALWMHQPPPIPVVKKVLPSNGTSFLALLFIAINMFYTFYRTSFEATELFILADRAGLVVVVNLPLLYLLAAKNQPLRVLTGQSYESLNIFHRRLGELLCLEAFIHSAGMLGAWYMFLRPAGLSLLWFLSRPIIFLGLGAFVSYEALYFTSLASFRARWYELFLFSHIALQITGLAFLYFHHHFAQQYVLATVAIFLIDRLVYRLGIKSTTISATTKILEDEDTIKLSAVIPLQPLALVSRIFGHSLKTGWQATDHVFLSVPSLSTKHIMQAHPFTIASPPTGSNAQEGTMELLIRAQDGFSRDLLNAARLHNRLAIRLDGPYGSSHARDMLSSSDLAILVAGGSGIAVCWPLVHHLIQSRSAQSASSSDIESQPLITRNTGSHAQKIVLVWIIHETTHLSWLGRPALQEAEYQGVEIIVPRATSEIGRPDLTAIIHGIMKTHKRSMKKQKENRIRVVASGPDGMGRSVRNTCASLVREGRDVGITVEKFGW